MKKNIFKLNKMFFAIALAITCILPSSLLNVSAIVGDGVSVYGPIVMNNTVTWNDGTGYGVSAPSYNEGGTTYYRNGSILEVRLSLPVDNYAISLKEEVHYDPTKVQLISTSDDILASLDSNFKASSWSNLVGIHSVSSTHSYILLRSSTYKTDVPINEGGAIAKIYFKINNGVETDAGTPITFDFKNYDAVDIDFNWLTPGYDINDKINTMSCDLPSVTVMAKSPSVNFNAKDGFITQSDAKLINTAMDLKATNKVVAELGDGTPLNLTATASNLAAIKSGTLGAYTVTYSYSDAGLSDSKTVKLNVIEDGSTISPDGNNAVYAKDKIITQSEAKALSSTSQLINLNSAKVTKSDGTSAVPSVVCSQFSTLKTGKIGAYPVTYKYGSGQGLAEKTVNVVVVPDGSEISPDGKFAVYAESGFIKESIAKNLTNRNELRPYNKAIVYLADGTTANPDASVSANNWTEIRSGNKGGYDVYYAYGSGVNETDLKVKITVIGDNDEVSKNEKYSLSADDIELSESEAKALVSQSDLIDLANALVTDSDGNTYTPQISVSDWTNIKKGVIGDYTIVFSYGSGDDAVSKTVTLEIAKDKAHQIEGENAQITQTQARALVAKEDLIGINKVKVTAMDGTNPTPSVTTLDFASIKLGTIGTYEIAYTYGTGDKQVTETFRVNVIDDDAATDEYGSLSAKDGFIFQKDAKALRAKADLIPINKAVVMMLDGTTPTPNVNVTTGEWLDVLDGALGTYNVTYSYPTPASTLLKKVKLTVIKDGSEVSENEKASLYAKDKHITVSQAKALSAKTDLSTYNEALVTMFDGSTATPNVTVTNNEWLDIKKGTLGSYDVMYTYGTGDGYVEKTVKITVVSDEAVISPDGKVALEANDGEITNDDAKKITKAEDLIPFNEAEVVFADGTTAAPTVSISNGNLNNIKNGVLGDYNITYSYGTGSSYVEKTVTISVVQKTRDVMLFDYNENGMVDSYDKARFSYYIMNEDSQTELVLLLSDANGNGIIDSYDVARINYHLMNPSDEPPYVKVPAGVNL
ncbi:hypothetical protein M2475_001695 [Breznakia sp. PF5-3]|uniref:dockerin type I domain-containing protein n=1 Tax=unclassified Breznakia TaxID=2623764 RepID=UPI0024077600|nr:MULTISPECIES: dockerin type I domain-containing protein [unclassified Breznakia]MDF9825239.1 hypothetical protein [Breznakia sp. PM6-1]MDF9836119.1 hypothetical protein [Breznakia sp. PF5-3]MDF9838392.1 hypothetical protein [Breznakia sp. PFB2-8]MDF9860408.1 hypothetical protein [Breznakia sp. PH5-24]